MRGHLLAVNLMVGLFLAGAAQAAGPVEVRIDNFTFNPQTISVPKGTKVVFVNHDDTPHRVVGVKNEFKSPVLDTDERYSWTPTEAGSIAYFCSMHPHMTGTLTVTEK